MNSEIDLASQYLYLLFDEDNELHRDDSNLILTTEGHLLSLDRSLEKPISPIRRELRRVEHLSCPVYQPPLLAKDAKTGTGLIGGIYARSDIDYARTLVLAPTSGSEEYNWSPDGWCQIPKVELYVSLVLEMNVVQNTDSPDRLTTSSCLPTARPYQKILTLPRRNCSRYLTVMSYKMSAVSVPTS